MKKAYQLVFALLIMGLLFNCSDYKSVQKDASKKDRNMFGHYIPRGLTINTEDLSPGYVMFSAQNSPSTYLIDRNGKVVHEWKGNYGAFNPYLMNDGAIVQGVNDPDYPVFGFGGPYGRIQKLTWESKMLWDFEYADEEQIVHHDFAILPNGNILAIAYETWSYEDAVENGRKSHLIPRSGPWMEKIIEIEPQFPSGGKIVWEWHVSDHLIQDNDETKSNFGNPSEHAELMDFNLGDSIPLAITQDSLDILKSLGRGGRNLTLDNPKSDIYHFNAINYNPELDQIVFSSPKLGEIFIIDHSTTTEEAAKHEGGKSDRGGDFLYRWGNPQNYHQGDSTDQKLFGQHDIRWIEKGKPGAGDLTVFNNDVPNGPDSLDYSAIYQITPPINGNGNYDQKDNDAYGPDAAHWKYIASDTLSFYGSYISGAHRMQNGNTFINEGPKGRFFEVNPEGGILWQYLSPFRGTIHKPNGDPVNAKQATYSLFRVTFIPADHPALLGKELKPLDSQPAEFKLPPLTDTADKES
ncbi:MAG: aryl-sulfate sulfotransferase [Maribacter sp.]|nr:aryl-sulfate sulfotransferase [Maribacter sp.]